MTLYTDELPPDSPIRIEREASYAAGELDINALRKLLLSPKLTKQSRELFEWFVADYERWLERQPQKSTEYVDSAKQVQDRLL